MSITFKSTGSFKNTEKMLRRVANGNLETTLSRYGEKGVKALKDATPKATGKTASSWSYKIERTKSGSRIVWYNSNNVNGVNIALILQYGHGTKNGSYITGTDYINPAIKPIFDEMAEEIWGEIR